MVSLAAMLTDNDGKVLQAMSVRVRPEGWMVPDDVALIHGLTTEILHETGVDIGIIMPLFEAWLRKADRRIAHNIVFDNKITRGELRRLGLPDHFNKEKDFCTMAASRKIMQMAPTDKMMRSGRHTNKPPKLAEAFEYFTRLTLKNAHQALADVHACRAIYMAIQERNTAQVKVDKTPQDDNELAF